MSLKEKCADLYNVTDYSHRSSSLCTELNSKVTICPQNKADGKQKTRSLSPTLIRGYTTCVNTRFESTNPINLGSLISVATNERETLNNWLGI